ncbi:hypothetical protein EOA85_32925 [Mesorhizobium sp. M5C.F.Ca.IN.020.29.1.1]|uniref:transcriptional repressor TraM n=1 Tax=Mesorhizobium sp. M5C.F.Ca.IN.020.29.1.1 TaxID=2496770 RepID=UPI000FCBF954|nr:transcriptional repressor TraM [Mesorhizobium sp. M5C.F.Ca.IN.020.29.1.1]RUV48749.1 hypothetical protein EOA85_32925 [Mesorhizobium sp. M5C.F.Ca.IN.020.29.1.1]
MVADTNSTVQIEHNITLRPVIGLTETLPKGDLEQITIEAIRTHRRLRDLAEARYEEWRKSRAVAACDTAGPTRIAYVIAMIDMLAQQTALSTLLDVLGHIPSVPALTPVRRSIGRSFARFSSSEPDLSRDRHPER